MIIYIKKNTGYYTYSYMYTSSHILIMSMSIQPVLKCPQQRPSIYEKNKPHLDIGQPWWHLISCSMKTTFFLVSWMWYYFSIMDYHIYIAFDILLGDTVIWELWILPFCYNSAFGFVCDNKCVMLNQSSWVMDAMAFKLCRVKQW